MRFLKIVLIIFSTIIFGGMFYLLFEGFSEVGYSGFTITRLGVLMLIVLFSLTYILYHIKTFRFYRRKEKRNLNKKVPKVLWAGTICFSSFLLFLMGNAMYNNRERFLYTGYELDDLFFTLMLLIPALIGFLEVSTLKKRIKRLKAERDTKDEINSIGNLIS